MSDPAFFDLSAVEAWLKRHLEGYCGPATISRLTGGQSNPTFLLKTPDRRYVLRRKPPGTLLKSAHAVDREFRVQRALGGSRVPVAPMYALCEDDAVIGSAFYVMGFVKGRSFDDPRLPGLDQVERGAVYREVVRVLAEIHSTDHHLLGLGDYGRPGNYFERQIDRWIRQYRASETGLLPAMERLMAWLAANTPPDDGKASLVHGDYRIDNLLFAHGAPRCAAVLDWELSTIGHPFADLAALLMQWRMPAGAEGRGLKGVDRAALGIPGDEELVADYCQRTGVGAIDNLPFYLAFCFFRMAAILQGVKRRGLDGNAADPERAAKLGTMVPIYAEGGVDAAGL
ncbi:MAG: phosphotransferase family protein [Pseudomonadota bacterium]